MISDITLQYATYVFLTVFMLSQIILGRLGQVYYVEGCMSFLTERERNRLLMLSRRYYMLRRVSLVVFIILISTFIVVYVFVAGVLNG